MQINKSDRNDAAGIARIMQTGWFKEVRVKDLDSHSVRALLASRALLVKIKRDLENQIRGLLKNVGLVIGRAKFNVFTVRAEELIAGRISKCGDAMLRSYLFEAAGVLLTRVPKWSALKAWGIRLAKRAAQSQGCRRSKACCHSAPNVDRRDRVQLVDEEGRRVTRNKEITEFPHGREKTSLPGRWRW